MNRKARRSSILSLMLTLALIAAMALICVSCDSSKQSTPPPTEQNQEASPPDTQVQTLGEGNVSFDFAVCFADGSTRAYVIKTDKETVGEALVEVGLISGYQGPYGLTVETVCGEFHDFNKDSMYWSLYINGEYAMTGVDSTPIQANEKYELKATRA